MVSQAEHKLALGELAGQPALVGTHFTFNYRQPCGGIKAAESLRGFRQKGFVMTIYGFSADVVATFFVALKNFTIAADDAGK